MSFLLILNPAGDGVTGTIATTDVADTSAVTAGHGPNGTSARTDVADVSAIVAGHGPNGTSARTDVADTPTISAGHGPNGTSARTDVADISSATAGHGPNATSSTTDAADIGAATGSHTPPAGDVTGTIATTDVDDISAATGTAGEVLPDTPAGGGFVWGNRYRRPREPVAVRPKPLPPRTVIGVATCVDADDIGEAFATAMPPDFDADLELLMLVGAI